jgi:hypothetical protein
MAEISLDEYEQIEDMMIDGLKIVQDTRLYRFTSDSVVLSKFARAKKNDKVADFCSGSGIVAFHFYALQSPILQKNLSFTLFEMQESLANLSKKTIALNDFTAFTVENCRLQDIPEQYRELLCGDYLMLREFSHEESFAPAGKSILQTMIYCMEDDAKALVALREDKIAYAERKKQMEAAVEHIICDRVPGLQGKIACLDSWTPATYERFVGSEVGSFMSFIMPASAAPMQMSGKIEGLQNVYLATQWQMAPGGLPIAATAGIDAVKLIGQSEKKR